MKRRLTTPVVVVLVVGVIAAARWMGASWREIVWGGLGFFACALAASFVQWLVSGGPLNLERRPPPDANPPG